MYSFVYQMGSSTCSLHMHSCTPRMESTLRVRQSTGEDAHRGSHCLASLYWKKE